MHAPLTRAALQKYRETTYHLQAQGNGALADLLFALLYEAEARSEDRRRVEELEAEVRRLSQTLEASEERFATLEATVGVLHARSRAPADMMAGLAPDYVVGSSLSAGA